jgi:hypothetical protein
VSNSLFFAAATFLDTALSVLFGRGFFCPLAVDDEASAAVVTASFDVGVVTWELCFSIGFSEFFSTCCLLSPLLPPATECELEISG